MNLSLTRKLGVLGADSVLAVFSNFEFTSTHQVYSQTHRLFAKKGS
jgi:hypothetical protein